MSNAPQLRADVLAAKQRLAEGRQKLRQRHQNGSPGIQVGGALADQIDQVVQALYASALESLGETGADGLDSQIALVAHSGYGRRDMAPHSDVDLMILHSPAVTTRVVPLAERMLRDLFDMGLELGQTVRTPKQACQLARGDAVICTSLIESRYLAGSESLFQKFTGRYQRMAHRHMSKWIAMVHQARLEERAQYGETVYLLEPNIKRSRGGLRDIQLLRWVGFIRYGTADPHGLRLLDKLAYDDYEALQQAFEFLLRLRNEMHFYAGKCNDVLDRSEQVRLAATFGYQGEEGLLPVERFMQDYFRLTNRVNGLVTRFVASARSRPFWTSLLSPLLSHRFEGDYRVGPTQIEANRYGLEKLEGDLAQILRLADLANMYDKPIAHETAEAIRMAVPKLPDEITPEIASRFLSILSQPARLAEILRSLHEMNVLEKIIPAFSRARSLLQFNNYHKYTVDEHCLWAVERATGFLSAEGPLGLAYRSLKRKWLLHLALLLHDLGKGRALDHSDVGLRIAADTAARLHLSDRDAETLKFLVHRHLMMSHLAFRRDTSDEQLIVRFAVEVGSPEVLQMLFLLTAADLAAVGPGVLNAWKVEVLADLYRRTRERLSGEVSQFDSATALREHRRRVLQACRDPEESRWLDKHLHRLPQAYLNSKRAEEIVADFAPLRGLSRRQVVAKGIYQPESNTLEYRIGTNEDITPGVFHKLTGALSGMGLQILSAEIYTLNDGLVFDRFFVQDPDYAGQPPPERLEAVCQSLVATLQSPDGQQPKFRRLWRGAQQRRQTALSDLPPQIRVDNSTSDRYTILDVFAADRMGLLYTISRTLFELGLNVSVAKIGTYMDQVVDVFYVTDQTHRKIEDEQRLGEIRHRVLSEIKALSRQEAEQTQV